MSNSSRHPRGLYLLFVTEMWERFSYYGMRAIFVLYMVKALAFDKEYASQIYGSYTGLVYLTPLIGGYIADRYWGNRRSIFWGGIMMAIGQFLMFLSASNYSNTSFSVPIMFAGLGAIIFGNGFFKPNISTMVGELYEPADKRKDSAYTIFYMGINSGALLAPLICGGLGDTGHPDDFKWGFLLAGLGMLLSVGIFEWKKNKYLVTPEGHQIGIIPTAKLDKPVTAKEEKAQHSIARVIFWSILSVIFISVFHLVFSFDIIGSFIYSMCFIIPGFIITDKSLTKIERNRIWVIFLSAFFVIFFWAAFEQAGASLTFFADEQTNRDLDFFGWHWQMPASYFQSFNAMFIVLMAIPIGRLWTFLGKRNIEPSSPTKQAIGLFLLAIGYLIIAFGVKNVEPGIKVSIFWLVSLYFIHTLGELCLSPIGLSMVNRLAPARFASLLMGVWFLSTAAANKFAGLLSGLYPKDGETTYLLGYAISNLYDFFMAFVFMAGVASVILFLISKKMQQMMHENPE